MSKVHESILQLVVAVVETGADAGTVAITAVNFAAIRGNLDIDDTLSIPFSGGAATALAAISSDAGGGPEIEFGGIPVMPTHLRIVGALTSA